MKNSIQPPGDARRSLLIFCLLLYPLTVFAHQRGGEAIGFASGFVHPISGLDHILAMVAVGMWGAQLGAPAIWVLPVTFPIVMAFGGNARVAGNSPSRSGDRNSAIRVAAWSGSGHRG